jgi:hypothetical protein
MRLHKAERKEHERQEARKTGITDLKTFGELELPQSHPLFQ